MTGASCYAVKCNNTNISGSADKGTRSRFPLTREAAEHVTLALARLCLFLVVVFGLVPAPLSAPSATHFLEEYAFSVFSTSCTSVQLFRLVK